jgi:WD40 repeat protein
VLAALAVAVVYLAGSPRSESARPVSLGEGAGQARAIAFGPGDQLLAATMLDGVIRIWRIGPGSDRAVSSGPSLPGFAAALSPDGATLAVGGDSAVTLGEAAPDRPRHALWTGDGWTCALAFSRDGQSFAAAGERGVTRWDTATAGERAATRIGLREAVSLALGPDGRSLVTGGRDGWVRFWDLETGRQRLALRPHARYVTALALSDDGRALASASDCERVARLWDVATGRGLVELRGHTAPVQAVAFAPGGMMVATGGADETVRLWDVPSGREWACLRCPGVRPGALAFSPDGRALAAGGDRAGGPGLGRLGHAGDSGCGRRRARQRSFVIGRAFRCRMGTRQPAAKIRPLSPEQDAG